MSNPNFDPMGFLLARSSPSGNASGRNVGPAELKNCSFRLDMHTLARVNWVARRTALSRSRAMVLLLQVGLEKFFAELPEGSADEENP